MSDRRCEYCGRKLHPALRKDARFCGGTCKSNGHRWRKQNPEPPPGPHEPLGRIPEEFIPLSNTIFLHSPPGATGYALRRTGCPHGNGVFVFPVPNRVTKHSDNTLRNASLYNFIPFESPRVPWEGYYEILYFVPGHGVVVPKDPEHQQIYVRPAIPRAAFDKQALWRFVPLAEGSLEGSSAYLASEIRDRAPAKAIGYYLSIENSPRGQGSFFFPVQGRTTRRSDGTVSDRPFFSLSPYETPMVPWPGYYMISYRMPDATVYADPDPERRHIRIGHIYPYADFDRFGIVPAQPMASPSGGPIAHGRWPAMERRLAGQGRPRPLSRRRRTR